MTPIIRHNRKNALALCLLGYTVLSLAVMPGALAKGRNVDWQQLNLSPSQAQSINQLESEWEETYRDLNAQIQRDKTELMREIGSANPDAQKVMQLQNRIAQNKAKLQNAATGVYLKKSDHLDPGQQKQLKKMMFSD